MVWSWFAARSALPAGASPGFSYEPPHDDDHIGKRDPEIDDPPLSLGAPHQLLVGVMPRAGAFYHPPFGGCHGSWLALLGNLGSQPASSQLLAGGVTVIGAVEMYARPIGQLSQSLYGVESVGQERRVMAIGRGDDDREGDAASVHGHRALDASFSSVHRTPTRFLAAARRLGDAAVDGQVSQFEAEEAVVSFERHLPKVIHHPGFDPLVAPTAQRGRRTLLVGDPPVGASKHQNLNQLLEHHPVGYPGSVAAKWMVSLPLRQ